MLTFLKDAWPWIFGASSIALAVMVTVHAVLWKRDSRSVIGWVGLAWLAPVLGGFAYFCFGINRVQRKAISLNVRKTWRDQRTPALTPIDLERRDRFRREHVNLIGLSRHGQRMLGRDLAPGNRVELLVDGDQAYPSMIEAIDGARRSVAFLSYIFDSDRAGEAFLEALVRARDRGVEVRVLIDDVGSKYSRHNMVARLKQAGLRAASFLPTRLPRLPKYANLRNHRKILVVDGQVGFTGGTNVREGHWLSLEPDSPVRCLHFRLEGPVVEHLQEVLAIDWAFATGESLSGELWFPDLKRAGAVWARGIPDGPDEDFEKMVDTIVSALSVARDRVRIVTPYFLPDATLVKALTVASRRGVDVRVLVPAKNNIPLVQWASTAELWQILEKDCRVFASPPPFDHTKVMTVDGVWSLIGSTNWDPRSLRLNFEFNVECYDDALAGALDRFVDERIAAADEVTLEDISSRSMPVRLRDGLARLFSPYL